MTPEPEYPHRDLIDKGKKISEELREQSETIEKQDPLKAEALRRLSIKVELEFESERVRLIQKEKGTYIP